MGKKIDMIGVQCNNWEVVSEGEKPVKAKNKSSIWWNCKCLKCGRIKTFNGTEIRQKRIGECHCDYQYSKPHLSKSPIEKNYLKTEESSSNKIINEVGNKYGKLTVDSFAYSKSGFAYWNCKCECGKAVVVRGNHLRTGMTKSCGCMVSFKEQEIEAVLQQYSICFQREYSFNDLLDKAKLRFDFAIFDKGRLIGLVEYQGRQHYEPKSLFNHHGSLQKHDMMKVEYCKKNNIPLLLLNKDSSLEQDIVNWFASLTNKKAK